MANDCDFDMAVRGKKKDINKLIEWLEADYDYIVDNNGMPKVMCDSDHHFYRIFDICSNENDAEDDKAITQIISGYCAWSVAVCMLRNVPFSYYQHDDDRFENLYKDIDLLEASELLNLTIEIYSREPGMCFAEHYLIDKGKMIIKDCEDYHEYYLNDFNSKKEAEKELGFTIDDSEWNEYHGSFLEKCKYDFEFSI